MKNPIVPRITIARTAHSIHADNEPVAAAAVCPSDSDVVAISLADVAVVVVIAAADAACAVGLIVVFAGADVVGFCVDCVGAGGVGVGAGADAVLATVTAALPCVPLKVFLLCASYASDAEPTLIVAVPVSFAVKVIVPNVLALLKPLGNPAVLMSVPLVLSTESYPLMESGIHPVSKANDVSCTSAAGYETELFTVYTFVPAGFTATLTVNVCPFVTDTVVGESEIIAAYAGDVMNAKRTTRNDVM